MSAEGAVIEGDGEADGAVEEIEVIGAGDFVAAEAGEVIGGPLGVVDDEAALFQPPLQVGEGHL